MEADEGVELFVAIFVVIMALPFVMAWLERTLVDPRSAGPRGRRPRRPR